jgi:fluoride exporter
MIKTLFPIGAGSFIGGISRFLLSKFVQDKVLFSFPLGTLVVNILGCLLIGIVYGWSERNGMSQEWRLFLATGTLGGFTTFSAFSNETVGMLRDGQFGYAGLYIGTSILLGVLATVLGIIIIKTI